MIRIAHIIAVGDSSEVPGARRVAIQCAQELRLSENATGRAALIATELATNLVKHGGGGSILAGSNELQDRSLILLSIDKGKGIANVNSALSDGFSTAGTQGTGLGAVQRASASFDLYTLRDHGTVVASTIEEDAPRAVSMEAPPRISVAGISIPKPKEDHNGDSWAAMPGRDVYTIGVADGLGHGPMAETASAAAVRMFAARASQSLEQMMEETHGELRPTRGAAAALARIHASLNRVDFLGVGNIAGTIASDDSLRKTVSLPGIVGHEMRKLQTFSYPWSASSVLILHSDGLGTSWNPSTYPGLLQHDAAVIAAVLYRDYGRGNDDATVVVAKATR
ncbi:MAG: SpoIIE family protein phosphatase [Acidobacteriota bacterium]